LSFAFQKAFLQFFCTCRSFSLVYLLLFCVPLTANEGDAKKEAELKWAKEVATDFLPGGMQSNYASAEALVTADFRKTLKDEVLFQGTCKGKKGEAAFSLRVVKEKDSGKWRVSFFAVGDYEEPNSTVTVV
jgi:hypothetical protein